MSAFNSRDYMEAMQKANKYGGMLYPVGSGPQLRVRGDVLALMA